MPRFIRKSQKEAGASPGVLVQAGSPAGVKGQISILAYPEVSFDEVNVLDIDAILLFVKKEGKVWLHIIGIQDTALWTRIGELFIHILGTVEIFRELISSMLDWSDTCLPRGTR